MPLLDEVIRHNVHTRHEVKKWIIENFQICANQCCMTQKNFLERVEKASEGYVIKVVYSNITDKVNGCFTESGIVGILEATELDNIDMVSLFIVHKFTGSVGCIKGM